MENSYECFQKWMKLHTDDINFVIDTFIEKSKNESNSFCQLIDADRISVAGHSLGGRYEKSRYNTLEFINQKSLAFLMNI